MAFDYSNKFERIVAKANLLSEKYAILLKSKKEVDARLESLETEISAKDKELEKLRIEVEYLRTAAVLSPSRGQIEDTRAIILGLVRDIDRCITDLSE